jgi:Asp-tRNA(Asn)/Glu-tRNA(Gln) amidotransferase A subunit family amidase
VPSSGGLGAAVAVADGMCEIAIGTDTGGSTRIPAAFCGVVGYKPTKSRVSTEGAFPLSYTLDSVGPIAKSVAACAAADAVMAGDDPAPAACRLSRALFVLRRLHLRFFSPGRVWIKHLTRRKLERVDGAVLALLHLHQDRPHQLVLACRVELDAAVRHDQIGRPGSGSQPRLRIRSDRRSL